MEGKLQALLPSPAKHNPYYLVNDLDVLDTLMTRDIGPINFDNDSPCPEFVEARAGQFPKSNPFQLSRHKYTYEWWIKTYSGVPYGKHPTAGGVKPSHEEMYREPSTDGSNWPTAKQLYTNGWAIDEEV